MAHIWDHELYTAKRAAAAAEDKAAGITNPNFGATAGLSNTVQRNVRWYLTNSDPAKGLGLTAGAGDVFALPAGAAPAAQPTA